jgi:hypothetical protein
MTPQDLARMTDCDLETEALRLADALDEVGRVFSWRGKAHTGAELLSLARRVEATVARETARRRVAAGGA